MADNANIACLCGWGFTLTLHFIFVYIFGDDSTWQCERQESVSGVHTRIRTTLHGNIIVVRHVNHIH